MRTLITIILIAATTTVAMASPRPYRSEGGRNCPSGYVGSGDFCRPSSSDARDGIPNRRGGACPSGYVSSGNACVESR